MSTETTARPEADVDLAAMPDFHAEVPCDMNSDDHEPCPRPAVWLCITPCGCAPIPSCQRCRRSLRLLLFLVGKVPARYRRLECGRCKAQDLDPSKFTWRRL